MNQTRHLHPLVRVATTCLLLLLGAFAGSRMAGSAAYAEVRPGAPRAAFLSGSERSEQILREISQTLKKIDGRLARLERITAAPRGPNGR